MIRIVIDPDSPLTVRWPGTKTQHYELANDFIRQEQSFEAEKRCAFTPDIVRLLEEIDEGEPEAMSDETHQALHDFLRGALHWLILKRFDRRISPQMERWGYRVTEIASELVTGKDDTETL